MKKQGETLTKKEK